MADKSVEERVGTLEQDAEHTKSSLTKIEGLFTSLHNDIHNTQAQSNSNFNAARVELRQDVERHRNETAANFEKLETRLKESIGETDSNLSDFKKETAANFEKLETRLKESIGETDSNLSDFKKETAANFAKSDANFKEFQQKMDTNFKEFQEKMEKMFGDLSKDVKEHLTASNAKQAQFDVELAKHKTNVRWIIIFGVGVVGTAFAGSHGWLGLIGKLLSGG